MTAPLTEKELDEFLTYGALDDLSARRLVADLRATRAALRGFLEKDGDGCMLLANLIDIAHDEGGITDKEKTHLLGRLGEARSTLPPEGSP